MLRTINRDPYARGIDVPVPRKRLFLYLLFSSVLFFPSVRMHLYAAGLPRIAVLKPGASRDIQPELPGYIQDLLIQKLLSGRRHTVVNRSELNYILEEQALQQSGCTDSTCVIDVGRLLSADQILSGTLLTIGNRITLSIQITEVKSGKTIHSRTETIQDLSNPKVTIDKLFYGFLSGSNSKPTHHRKRTEFMSVMKWNLLYPGLGSFQNGELISGSLFGSMATTALLMNIWIPFYDQRKVKELNDDVKSMIWGALATRIPLPGMSPQSDMGWLTAIFGMNMEKFRIKSKYASRERGGYYTLLFSWMLPQLYLFWDEYISNSNDDSFSPIPVDIGTISDERYRNLLVWNAILPGLSHLKLHYNTRGLIYMTLWMEAMHFALIRRRRIETEIIESKNVASFAIISSNMAIDNGMAPFVSAATADQAKLFLLGAYSMETDRLRSRKKGTGIQAAQFLAATYALSYVDLFISRFLGSEAPGFSFLIYPEEPTRTDKKQTGETVVRMALSHQFNW